MAFCQHDIAKQQKNFKPQVYVVSSENGAEDL